MVLAIVFVKRANNNTKEQSKKLFVTILCPTVRFWVSCANDPKSGLLIRKTQIEVVYSQNPTLATMTQVMVTSNLTENTTDVKPPSLAHSNDPPLISTNPEHVIITVAWVLLAMLVLVFMIIYVNNKWRRCRNSEEKENIIDNQAELEKFYK